MAFLQIDFPSRSITDALCSNNMALAASKHVRHQSIDKMPFGRATPVAAVTEDIHIVQGATGQLVAFQATINGAIATGADRTISVDLQKSSSGGAFASVLTAPIAFTNASTLRTAMAAAIASANLVVGDMLAVVITVAGGAAAQALGLSYTVTTTETYG